MDNYDEYDALEVSKRSDRKGRSKVETAKSKQSHKSTGQDRKLLSNMVACHHNESGRKQAKPKTKRTPSTESAESVESPAEEEVEVEDEVINLPFNSMTAKEIDIDQI